MEIEPSRIRRNTTDLVHSTTKISDRLSDMNPTLNTVYRSNRPAGVRMFCISTHCSCSTGAISYRRWIIELFVRS